MQHARRHILLFVIPIVLCSCASHFETEKDTVGIGIIGDYGSGDDHEHAVAQALLKLRPDAIVTVGDNTYGGPGSFTTRVAAEYGAYIRGVDGVSDGRRSVEQRFFPALGNHDIEAGTEEFHRFFNTPGNGRTYATQLGPARIYVLSSDPSEPEGIDSGSRQEQWLRQELLANTTPWTIIVMHHPAFSSVAKHGAEPRLRWAFTGATLILQGHNHMYERLHAQGKTWITVGNGGKELYSLQGAPATQSEHLITGVYGFGFLRMNDRWMQFTAISETGAVLDRWEARR
jgi:hypothetical protein